MHILLTNDDGIFAPGLAALYKELISLWDVTVVAPADSKSGASHSITIHQPLMCNEVDIHDQFTGYSVHGSPADCVKLAFMQLCERPVDLVVAGINNGANVGINIYYSGTVAAAMEGAFLKIPAVAMSLAREDEMDFETAAKHGMATLKQLLPIQSGDVININIPQLNNGKPKGIKVVPQSTQAFQEYYIHNKDNRGNSSYQLAGGAHLTDQIVADTGCLLEGYITVTALSPGMTNYEKNRQLERIPWTVMG